MQCCSNLDVSVAHLHLRKLPERAPAGFYPQATWAAAAAAAGHRAGLGAGILAVVGHLCVVAAAAAAAAAAGETAVTCPPIQPAALDHPLHCQTANGQVLAD
eukprot:scaffold48819_cov17-Tisochrysis_lutea.AAC.2